MNCRDGQIDVLKEIVSVGIGNGANALNMLLGSHVHLEVPSVKVLSPKKFEKEMQRHEAGCLSAVNLPFRGDFSGIAELVFPSESASRFIAILTDEETGDLDINSIRAGTLSEVGNIVLNAVMGSISNLLRLKLSYSIPNYTEGDFDNLLPFHMTMPDTTVLLVRTHFKMGTLEIEGDIILFFEVGSFDKLMEAVDARINVQKW